MNQKTTQPISWNEFQNLATRMMFDVENIYLTNRKKTMIARMGATIVAGCYLGLRYSDLCRLKWSDFHHEQIEVIEKKTNKKRRMFMNPRMVQDVMHFKKYAGDCETISPITLRAFNMNLANLFTYYGIRAKGSPSSHTLRKTFGKRVYMKAGESEKALVQLSELFSHSSLAVTRKYIGLKDEIEKDIYTNLHM